MICLFHRLCKSQQFPQDGLFSGEKDTLVESNEPSLIKVRWLAHLYDRITHYEILDHQKYYLNTQPKLLISNVCIVKRRPQKLFFN